MESALDKIVGTGTLGALLVVSFIVIYFLYKENKGLQDARLNDLKLYTNEDKLFIAQIKETLENVLALIRGEKK